MGDRSASPDDIDSSDLREDATPELYTELSPGPGGETRYQCHFCSFSTQHLLHIRHHLVNHNGRPLCVSLGEWGWGGGGYHNGMICLVGVGGYHNGMICLVGVGGYHNGVICLVGVGGYHNGMICLVGVGGYQNGMICLVGVGGYHSDLSCGGGGYHNGMICLVGVGVYHNGMICFMGVGVTTMV